MRKIIITLIFLSLTFAAFAQDFFDIKGKILDPDNKPIVGVSVVVNGTNIITESDLDGCFSIKVKKGQSIKCFMIGFTSEEILINKNQYLNISLKQDVLKLTELVVTGYSRQERRDITGSVATVKPTMSAANTTIDKMLQGQATGVYMSTSSGALGSANQLVIRGISSIMGDNNPLYVIDGVPLYSTNRNENLTNTSGGSTPAVSMIGVSVSSSISNNKEISYGFEKNPLSSLNPDDIESIEILKDAFATAIYGSRGSAGVILITTKKGVRDRTKVDINYSFSTETPIAKLDLLNGKEYNMIYSILYPNSPFTSDYDTDWMKTVTRKAYGHNISASVSGGTEKTNYFISAAMNKNESYIVNNSLDRYSARVNLDSKLSKIATIGTNISISMVDNKALTAPTVFAMAARKSPNLPIYDKDGNYFYGKGNNPYGNTENYNPLAMAMDNKETSIDTRVTGNLYLEFRPLSWLTLKTDCGTDIVNGRTSIRKANIPIQGVAGSNRSQESVNLNARYVINNTINASKEWKTHFIQAILGQSYEQSNIYINSISGSDFFSSSLVGVGAAQNKRVLAGGETKYALFSAFARVNYQFMRKYIIGATYRLDGSSRYNKNNRYLGTPSISLAWRISEEKFIKNNIKWIDDIKIRSSIGWASRDANSGYYGSQAIYNLITDIKYGKNQYLSMSQPGNANLGWEKTITYDIGLDMTLFNRRVDITLDYYLKKTSDMLFGSDVPGYTGYKKQDQNIGDMSNQGLELRFSSHNIQSKNFQWMTTLTISRNTNKILKLNFEGNQLDQLNSTFKYYAVGYPAGLFYLHNWAGVDPNTGNPLWLLKDGSLTTTPPASKSDISSSNKFICGSAQPKFYGGITNSFLYKDIELSFLFTFSYGGYMINNTKAQLLTYSTIDANNLDKDVLKFWQIYGHKTDMPKFNNESIIGNNDYTASSTITRFLEDNSFIRLKNLEIAYSLPKPILEKSKIIKQLRIFASVTNLFTLTKYSGLDPEVSAFGSSATASGYDNLTMPQSRTFLFGIKLGF